MFERYTEKARRVVFDARHAASQHGTPEIGTQCLLLGILWEDKGLMARLLPGGQEAIDLLSVAVDALIPTGSRKIPGDVDLPLSPSAQRALRHASDEANRRHHQFIEPRHVLWGLLTEGGPETACLMSHRISVEAVNSDLSRIAGDNGRMERKELRRTLEAVPDDRLDAAIVLLEGLVSGKFEAAGTTRKGPFRFSFGSNEG